METLERHSDSIDKLTSLVSKINVKVDKKETPYKPKAYQGRPRGQSRKGQQLFSPTIGPSAEIGIETEGIIIVGTIIDPTTGTVLETIIDMTIGETTTSSMIDEIIIDETVGGEIATDKTIEIDKIIEEMTPDKDTGIGMEVGIDQEITVETVLEVEIEIETDGCNKEPELCQITEKYLGPGPIQE